MNPQGFNPNDAVPRFDADDPRPARRFSRSIAWSVTVLIGLCLWAVILRPFWRAFACHF